MVEAVPALGAVEAVAGWTASTQVEARAPVKDKALNTVNFQYRGRRVLCGYVHGC